MPPDATILAFGDSLTYGTGAAESQSYPAALERLIGRRVVRSGVPGEVSSAGLSRLPGVLAEAQPKLLILIHGGNDLIRRLDERQTASNVSAMARMARERGIEVLLLGVPKPGLVLSAPSFYGEIANSHGLAYDADTLPGILKDNALKSDLAHPNALGYARLAESIARRLREAKAI